ncbi:MAG: hypothetical protein EAZ43_07170 [Betaproteobacteria bacterium]|nr:MAG: hypothetical protein EAZ43_07170 [Betaproteobacteria bacterium]
MQNYMYSRFNRASIDKAVRVFSHSRPIAIFCGSWAPIRTAGVAIAMIASGAALAAPGSLDLSFGFGNGKVITPITTNADDNAHAMAIQTDGKIVLVGACGTTTSRDFCVARFEPTGALDTTFSTDGKVITQVGAGNSDAYAVAIQSDGKIVVAGQCGNVLSRDFCLVRYNPNGTVNANFGINGQVITAVGTGDDAAESMAIQGDGKIVVAGTCSLGSADAFCVARYNTDGSLDDTFAGDGKVITSVTTDDDVARAVAVQSDGKIVVAGYCGDSSVSVDFCALRYLSTGAIDTSFDFDGRVTTAIGTFIDVANSIALQADGKMIVAGATTPSGGDTAVGALRYNPFGSLDTSFSGNGTLSLSIGIGADSAQRVAIQPDGKIVLAGNCEDGSGYDFCVARLNSDGTLDNTFSSNGSVITPISANADDKVAGVALDSEGNIVVAGSCGTAPNRDFCIARYEGGPFGARQCSLDIDGDGKVLATTDMLIGTRIALGMTGSAVIGGITFPANATRDQWGTNTSRDIRKYLVSQCGMNLP